MHKNMNVKEIKVDVNLDESDLIRFSQSRIYSKPGVKFVTVIGMMVCLFSPVIIWALLRGFRLPVEAYYVLALGIFAVLLPLIIKMGVRKAIATNKFIGSTHHYCFTSNEINIQSETGTAKFGWEKINRAEEAKRDFILHVDNVQFYLLPKRFFSNEQDMEILRIILRENLEKKQLKNV